MTALTPPYPRLLAAPAPPERGSTARPRVVSADRLIRAAMAVAVTAVAAFAAIVSYSHIDGLALSHGQDGAAARLLPLSVDGLILAASLAMMHAARARRPAPPLARLALWLGIAATVAANIAYGVPYGPLGAAVSAWPALSFVIAVELLMSLIRGHAQTAAPPPLSCPLPQPAPVITGAPGERRAGTAPGRAPAAGRTRTRTRGAPRAADASRTRTRTRTRTRGGAPGGEAAEVHFAADLAEGRVPSARRVKAELHVGQDRAARIHDHLSAVAAAPGGPDRPRELSGSPS